jgi:hypothetical protein
MIGSQHKSVHWNCATQLKGSACKDSEGPCSTSKDYSGSSYVQTEACGIVERSRSEASNVTCWPAPRPREPPSSDSPHSPASNGTFAPKKHKFRGKMCKVRGTQHSSSNSVRHRGGRYRALLPSRLDQAENGRRDRH